MWCTDVSIYFFENFRVPFPHMPCVKLRHLLEKLLPFPHSSLYFCNCSLPHSWNISVPTTSFYRWNNKVPERIKLSIFIRPFNARTKIRIQEPWVPPLYTADDHYWKTHTEHINSTKLKHIACPWHYLLTGIDLENKSYHLLMWCYSLQCSSAHFWKKLRNRNLVSAVP